MAKPEVPYIDADELDAFWSNSSRQCHRWQRGELKKLKRRVRKRIRRFTIKQLSEYFHASTRRKL